MSRQKKASEAKVYRIGIIEDETHKQVWGRKLTLSDLVIAFVILLFTVTAIIYCLVAFTPVRTTSFIPNAAISSACFSTSSDGMLLLSPRAKGTVQYAQ